MGRQISELPREIQRVVHERQRTQGNDGSFTGDLEISARGGNFTWDRSPEGELFWINIYQGDDSVFYKKYDVGSPIYKNKKVNTFDLNLKEFQEYKEPPKPKKYRKIVPSYEFIGKVFLVSCEEHADILCDAAHNSSYSWNSGRSFSKSSDWKGYAGGQYYRIDEGFEATQAKAEAKLFWGKEVVLVDDIIDDLKEHSPKYASVNEGCVGYRVDEEEEEEIKFDPTIQKLNLSPRGTKLKRKIQKGSLQLTGQFM